MTNSGLANIAEDPDAFEAFYREHIDAVQRFVVRRVADPHAAADLTADVFLAAIGSAHTYRSDRGTPTAWLYGVAYTVVSAEFRRRAREQDASRRNAGQRVLDPDDVSRLEERIDAEAAARDLAPALDRLPSGERAVLELVALDGLSIRDAAVALGIRPVAARVRLHRARIALRARARPLHRDLAPTSVTNTSISPEATR
jgi:RNA polymerase sigma factor (sigma-70 family)